MASRQRSTRRTREVELTFSQFSASPVDGRIFYDRMLNKLTRSFEAIAKKYQDVRKERKRVRKQLKYAQLAMASLHDFKNENLPLISSGEEIVELFSILYADRPSYVEERTKTLHVKLSGSTLSDILMDLKAWHKELEEADWYTEHSRLARRVTFLEASTVRIEAIRRREPATAAGYSLLKDIGSFLDEKSTDCARAMIRLGIERSLKAAAEPSSQEDIFDDEKSEEETSDSFD